MKITSFLCTAALLAAALFSTSCNAQKPKLAEFNGQYTGRWELDVESRTIESIKDPINRKELDERDWEVYGESFSVTSTGQSTIYVTFQNEKLKLDLKKIKSEKDDGAMEHEALLALDANAVNGKEFSYKSADGSLDLKFTITEGKLELESGVRIDSKFELPKKEFEGEYLVNCIGTFKGESVKFKASLEISFPK